MKIDGNCHCGAIAYEAEVDPHSVTLCHCADCQRLSGAAYRANIRVAAADFNLLRGTPKTYFRTADSGRTRMQAFCGDCGSSLWSGEPEDTPYYALRTGTINQRAALRPAKQIWRRSAMPWVDDLSTVSRFDEQG